MKKLNKILIYLFVTIFFACSTPKQKEFERIEKYFKEVHNFIIDDKIDKIIVITEGTGCPTCDNTFSKTVLDYSKNANTIFLVSATGKFIDIQPFLNIEKNCFFDCEFNREEYPEFANTSVIFLKNNTVDTTIIIKSELLPEQLEYIESRNYEKNNKQK